MNNSARPLPLPSIYKGLIDWFSWMVTLNLPSELKKETKTSHNFSLNLTHESIYFLQSLSTSYVYRDC